MWGGRDLFPFPGLGVIAMDKILVIEDDRMVQKALRRLFESAGYCVDARMDGVSGLESFRAMPPAAVVLDLRLPGRPGQEVCREIKQQSPALPIIVLSATTDVADKVLLLEQGADDYVTKPFDMDELRARVAIGARILELESRLKDSLAITAELAVRDGLTGLFNRRAFDNRLADEVQRAVRYQRPLSLLMIDIDYFKLYNDQHGHPQGDALLRELSTLLLGCVRSTDFVARYGGEEFVVILPETNAGNALAVARSMLERVCVHPFPYRETQPGGSLTVSIGVAGFESDHPDPARLLSAADQALYRAKGAGRNRAVAA